jgi:hypothetical protein
LAQYSVTAAAATAVATGRGVVLLVGLVATLLPLLLLLLLLLLLKGLFIT